MRALFSAANVSVRVQDFSTPAIQPFAGALWRGGWHRGTRTPGSYSPTTSGLRHCACASTAASRMLRTTAIPSGERDVRCDFTGRRPCHDIPGGVRLDTAVPAGRSPLDPDRGGRRSGQRGRNRSRDRRRQHAPARVNASVEGGEGWRRSNDFAVRWPPPAERCRRSPGPTTASARRAGASLQYDEPECRRRGADRVELPAPGDYTLRVWLEDEAGNASSGRQRSGAPAARRSPPEAAFELLDERDPTKLDVRASDATSGVAGGAIEIAAPAGGSGMGLPRRSRLVACRRGSTTWSFPTGGTSCGHGSGITQGTSD